MYAHRPTQESLVRDCFQSIQYFERVLKDSFSQFNSYLNTEFEKLFTRVIEEVKGLLHDSRSSFISEVPQIIGHRTYDMLIPDPEVSAGSPVSSEGNGPSESPLDFPVPLDPYEEAIPIFQVYRRDFEHDHRQEVYHFPCPCGDRFEVEERQMEVGEQVAKCPRCCERARIVPDSQVPINPHPHPEDDCLPDSPEEMNMEDREQDGEEETNDCTTLHTNLESSQPLSAPPPLLSPIVRLHLIT